MNGRTLEDFKVSTHMPLARHDGIYGFKKWLLRFLLTCLLRGMTIRTHVVSVTGFVSTHMPLARHDIATNNILGYLTVSTHMPLARHDWAHSR